MTTVTGAVRAPHVGSFDEIGTAASSSLQTPSAKASALAVASDAWVPLRSRLHIMPIPAMKQRRKPTMAVPLFILFLCHAKPKASLKNQHPHDTSLAKV